LDHASRRRGRPVIVGCGEALVDFTVERSERGPLYSPHVGGASLNVAVALARLGVAAGFLGGLSGDAFGRFLRAQLLASGVDPRYVCERAEPTALAFVQQEDGREPAFSFYGQGTAERALRLDDLPPAFPPDAEALHFAGYSLLVEPVGTTLETLGRREQGRRLIFLDPNVRPALTPDLDAGLARLEAWGRPPDARRGRAARGARDHRRARPRGLGRRPDLHPRRGRPAVARRSREELGDHSHVRGGQPLTRRRLAVARTDFKSVDEYIASDASQSSARRKPPSAKRRPRRRSALREELEVVLPQRV